tara:strand:+ start:75 stop:668 length:594 start_codon:yes stop_codon:yes gene_type:complete
LKGNPKIVTVILASGASTRMGEPKQLLSWKSSTLLNHCINEVTQANIHQTIVVLGANHKQIEPTLNNSNIKCLINKNWEKGMSNSIALVTQHLKRNNADGLFIVLADQQFVKKNYLNLLINKFTPNKKQIIATNYDDNIGVPAIFDKHYFEELSLLKEKKGAKKMIHHYAKNVINIIPDFDHQDIDTPEEYRTMKKM